MKPSTTSLHPTLLLLIVGILWGLNWPAVKYMMSELPVFTIRAIAFPCAALILAGIAWIKNETLLPARDEILPLLITGSLLVFAFNMLTSLGQSLTEASRAAIIAYTMPAMTAALSVRFLNEKMNFRILVALLLGTLGILTLISEDFAHVIAHPGGLLVMLLAALLWSAGNIAMKLPRWRLQPTARAAWFFAISTILCWPIVWVLEPPGQLTLPGAGVTLTLIYHIIGPMVISYLLWTVLIARMPVSITAISVLTAPVVGVVFSIIFLSDELTWQKATALLLILTSIGFTYLRTPDSTSIDT